MDYEYYLSAAEVAKYAGVTYRTIENWAAQEFLSRDKGKYGLISALQYRIKKLEAEVTGLKDNPKAELQIQKLTEEVAERKAIARIKNMEADLMAEKLVDAKEVLDAWKNEIINVRAKMLAIPSKMALELSGLDKPEDIQERLNRVIDEALIELSGE